MSKPQPQPTPPPPSSLCNCRTPILPVQVYYFIPVGFRGDLKQMCQAFNLTRKPGAEKAQRPHMAGSFIKDFCCSNVCWGAWAFSFKTYTTCIRIL